MRSGNRRGQTGRMRILPERSYDQESIRRVHRAAFAENGEHVAELADALRQETRSPRAFSLVAVPGPSDPDDDAVDDDDQVVGNVVVGFGWVDAPSRLVTVGVLSPIGVLPRWQRRGVGSALVRGAVELLTEQAVPLLFLEGDPGYYPRFGFRPGGDLGFGKPSDRIPDAAFQVLKLPTYEAWMTGTLVYPDTFWRLDAVGLR